MRCLLLLLLPLIQSLLLPCEGRGSQQLLDVAFDDHASFRISINGRRWLDSAPMRMYANGKWQDLTRSGVAVHSKGRDVLGQFSCVNVSWASQPAGLALHTALKTYEASDMAVFVQQLPAGSDGTNASNPVLPGGLRVMDPGDYPPIISFPSLTGARLETLGFVTWQSRMINVEYGTNVTQGPRGTNEPLIKGRGLQGLATSGPVVLFDEGFNSLVVAPMDNFKSVVHHVRRGVKQPTWDTGVTSELTDLPPGFEHRTMVVAGAGITAAMDSWGQQLRKAHGTNRSVFDPNIEYLSYWTDNGAYYSGGAWAKPKGGAGGGGEVVNEAAFRAVARGLEEKGLLDAVRVWQLDDWWYETSVGGVYSACIYNWTLPTRTFPSGLKALSHALKTPWLLYVPFWCPQNVYSKRFRWVSSYNPLHPELIFSEPHPDDSLNFYRMLFDYGVANGMVGYENDYLDYNYLSIPYLRKTFGAANTWLAGMNAAAVERDIPVQICMALPSDAMASVQFDSMTNVRSSTDYGINDDRDDSPVQPGGIFGDSNFNIGGSSLLAWALGLRPSKDIFWTHRPSSCRGNHTLNPQVCGRWGVDTNPGRNCELNAIVATLSTGPVSIADKAGDTNATILKRCVAIDGRILQPDKPATAVDSMFAQGGERTAPPGEVWSTFTKFPNDHIWHYLLSIDMKTPWRIHGRDLYPMMVETAGTTNENWVAHQWFTGHSPTSCLHGALALASGCVIAHIRSAEDIPPLHNRRPVMVQNDTRTFDLLQLAPVVNGWSLLGEVGRYVRVSRDRFDEVSFFSSGIHVALSGTKGETTAVTALEPLATGDWKIHVKNVTFATSTIEFSFQRDA